MDFFPVVVLHSEHQTQIAAMLGRAKLGPPVFPQQMDQFIEHHVVKGLDVLDNKHDGLKSNHRLFEQLLDAHEGFFGEQFLLRCRQLQREDIFFRWSIDCLMLNRSSCLLFLVPRLGLALLRIRS
jgi:hypothetical protein